MPDPEQQPSFFGPMPHGFPSEFYKSDPNRVNTYDLMRAVERGSSINAKQQEMILNELAKVKGSGTGVGTILGGLLGAGAGYGAARLLTNLGEKSQIGAGAGGAALGALIGQALQRVHQQKKLLKQGNVLGQAGNIAWEMSGIPSFGRAAKDVGRAVSQELPAGRFGGALNAGASALGHAALGLTSWLPYTPGPWAKLGLLSRGAGKALRMGGSGKLHRAGEKLQSAGQASHRMERYIPAASPPEGSIKNLANKDWWTSRAKDPVWWAKQAPLYAPMAAMPLFSKQLAEGQAVEEFLKNRPVPGTLAKQYGQAYASQL